MAAAVEVAMALHDDSEPPERGFLEHPGSWRDAIKRDWREIRVAPLPVRADKDRLRLGCLTLCADQGGKIAESRASGGPCRRTLALFPGLATHVGGSVQRPGST